MGAKLSHPEKQGKSKRTFSCRTNNTHPQQPRVSSGRVSVSYAPTSPSNGARRKRVSARGKAHSDPSSNISSSRSDTRFLLSTKHVFDYDDEEPMSHRGHNVQNPCCAQCMKSGMEWDKYKPSAVVKDYAAVSTQNSRFRKHMEDECVAIPKFKAFHGDPGKNCFFGVYDGHGGSFCSRYAAKNFHSRLSSIMATKVQSKQRESDGLGSSGSTASSEVDGDLLNTEDIEKCYVEAYATIDEELANYDESADCGSTAVTCLIRKFNGRTSFHIANLGDSRAILFEKGRTTRLTVDHKATNEDEANRIRANKGIILNKRVGGVLSVTRAFGQTDEKEFITADPHTLSGEVKSNNSFLILASDGVSDVFSDEEVTEFVLQRLERGEKSITICKSLLDEAKAQGGMDNMTAVLICFSDSE